LRRLGLYSRPLWPIPVEISVPSVGQGALAIEVRQDDKSTREILSKLDHAASRACVEAERAFLAKLGGDCHTPIGGHAALLDEGRRIRFEGWVGSIHGDKHVRAAQDMWIDEKLTLQQVAAQAASEVATTLLTRGASELIEQAKNDAKAQQIDPRKK